ncbi:hypothetical protein H1P_360021 [Hyella patelloides LEGE 07179]|uniref:Uncharacterized protein n=1 Tax=Hyella patelloides LEGE 07179 TaxID=945734 RepID=A0A563VW95_9CYAN|nr:hypothetical protein H1P_360021 [Hyella patelloides LEGE 07179]
MVDSYIHIVLTSNEIKNGTSEITFLELSKQKFLEVYSL